MKFVLRSYEIAKIRGISILLHSSFIIFITLLILALFLSGGALYAITGALYLIFLFSFVVLHELAHSLTAKSYGINVRKITLLPIGGVAELERYPKDPKVELRISAAGPLSNFLLAILFLLTLYILNLSISYSSLGTIPEVFDI
ncbi:MAG: site-2 protease family protein, partial [Archaeoglobi archaeon]|nr:site-2 protease family protein [Candidatus Mnemosynella sp.]